MIDNFHGDNFTKDEQELFKIMRKREVRLKTNVQNISDINKRDSYIENVIKIKDEYFQVNKTGKSFIGHEKMSDKLNKIRGNMNLCDLSDHQFYNNWYFNMASNLFIVITSDGEKEIAFNDVFITE